MLGFNDEGMCVGFHVDGVRVGRIVGLRDVGEMEGVKVGINDVGVFDGCGVVGVNVGRIVGSVDGWYNGSVDGRYDCNIVGVVVGVIVTS